MQNTVIHILKAPEGGDLLDTCLSFRGFIRYLKERKAIEKTQKVKFIEFLIHRFEERLQGKDELTADELPPYADLLEYMYAAISAPLSDERENLWALSVPMVPEIVYGTDSFYALLIDPKTGEMKARMMEKDKAKDRVNLELVYSVVLQQLYHYPFSAGDRLIRSWANVATGLTSFYRLNIDARFIEVTSKGELPPLDPRIFGAHPSHAEMMGWLKEHLPLGLFKFRGFTAVTVTDVTKLYILNEIRAVLLDASRCVHGSPSHDVLKSLQILVGTSDVEFGLMPFLKVNGRPVFSGKNCHFSLFAEALKRPAASLRRPMAAGARDAGQDVGGDRKERQEYQAYLDLLQNYYHEPKLLLYERLPVYRAEEDLFMGALRKEGIQGYGLAPVFHNSELVGVLELSSRKKDVVNAALLAELEGVLPLLAQLLQRTSDDFNERIKAIVKENFTSIQPAVEWKFNEAAWRFEQGREMGEPSAIGNIHFPDVYPLYGAVDIRNSTLERNGALRRDLQAQFRILTETLESLRQAVSLDLLDELIFQSRKWEKALEGALTTADELNLNSFLADDAGEFLEHFGRSRPDTAALLDPYRRAINPATGVAFKHRRELEGSIQQINQAINEHLEAAAEDMQRTYPCYFEKFRTDGVEYDIYAGQAIAPDRPFDALYLHNLRLWQVNSMVMIARLTEGLEMMVPLKTTQLIFVHTAPIDISFRKDERRFDVEGGYNIRYQVVKKRIDKVHLRDTNERLTQPGTVAIVYFNDKEAEEYAGYIRYLQEKDWLKEGTEYLELEELQGVSGLRALRVAVKL